MDKNSFTVVSSRGEKISSILIFLLVCVPLSIAGLIILDNLLLRVICICLFALGVFAVLSSFMISVTVDGEVLKGRSVLARKYEMKLSEIKKIKCSEKASKNNLPNSGYSISLCSDKRNIKLTHGMACFEKMAGYISGKCDDNVINKDILDEQGQKSLKEYLKVWNEKNGSK